MLPLLKKPGIDIWCLIEEADLTVISGLLTEEPESGLLLEPVKSNEEKEGVFQDTAFLHNHMKKEHLRATFRTWFCSDIELIQSELTFQPCSKVPNSRKLRSEHAGRCLNIKRGLRVTF